ncbi:hypothetical protein [Variovorax arabinosiphilus]|uniref:hypothetical protein n=1 Tax=Variovorax arabinosiphilus TaxID=3053498 RepID=UPI002578622C|nr:MULTISPECIES: hypothetical protein [unclassified Variovorax]MDM0120428.1 hypothetical protein [Variovorax sp. J2L1-78]MDM0127660.1 hypothetical protein [Variovorax sp. J2L1-63]MDM0231359.1 hypothetical protein [Variovorax sp. J2R1-6]
MDPATAYELLMGSVQGRLSLLNGDIPDESVLYRAERFALHVRKIVEAVSFAALSATEFKNGQLLQQRTKDASQVLAWLDQKKLLRLPEAQRVTRSSNPLYGAVCEGNSSKNLGVPELQRMFSRASSLVHERHPERLSQETIKDELQKLEKDAQALRHWLWSHIVFFGGSGFLLQMGMFGTLSFMTMLTRENGLSETKKVAVKP